MTHNSHLKFCTMFTSLFRKLKCVWRNILIWRLWTQLYLSLLQNRRSIRLCNANICMVQSGDFIVVDLGKDSIELFQVYRTVCVLHAFYMRSSCVPQVPVKRSSFDFDTIFVCSVFELASVSVPCILSLV